jgi:hypothetical protein
MTGRGFAPDTRDDAIEKLLTLIASGERVTIAEAAERTGISVDVITNILAVHYAIADELLKLIDPRSRSLH